MAAGAGPGEIMNGCMTDVAHGLCASAQAQTVVVIDQDPATRAMARRYLQELAVRVEDYERIEDVSGKPQPVNACVLLEVTDNSDGPGRLCERVRALSNQLPVVVMSDHPRISTAVALMESGAISVLEKPLERDTLLSSVRRGLEHAGICKQNAARREADALRLSRLTAREREVLVMVANGEASKRIGRLLGVSVRTIEKHRQHILAKMGADSWAELIGLCERQGLTRSEPRNFGSA